MIDFLRLSKMDISRRGLLTGLCGHTQDGEFFVGPDLCTYNFTQALYCSMKAAGYRAVIFNANSNQGYYSYVEDDLIEFENFQREGEATRSYIKKGLMTPFGPMEELDDEEGGGTTADTHHPSIYTHNPGNPSRMFFKLSVSGNPFDDLFAYAERHRDEKMAVIFENPGSIDLSPEERITVETGFANLLKDFSVDNVQLRILVIYPEMNQNQLINAFTGGEANPTFFYSHSVAVHLGLAGLRDNGAGAAMSKEQQENFRRNMFRVGTPEEDEIRNLLVTKRVVANADYTLRPGKPFDALVRAIGTGNFKVTRPDGKSEFASEEDMTVRALQSCDLQALVDGIKTDGARQWMSSLPGLERQSERIFRRVELLKSLKDSGLPVHLRLTWQFLGSPGTGKTIMARGAGQLMRDAGLLSKGHFVEASAADLEGQYVGETRVKTQAVVEKANGGVLFIDEAYTLFKEGREGSNIYGQEALEVLMLVMENNADISIIMAGYPDEMQQMEKANPGIPSRFPAEGRIYFDDYSPETLFAISKTKEPKEGRTKEFDDKLMTIIKFLYSRRSRKTWGNAREVEEIMNGVLGNYLMDGGKGPVEARHIPEKYLKEVDTAEKSDKMIFSPLDGLIGLGPVKEKMKENAIDIRSMHILAQGQEGEDYDYEINLCFVFVGRPGSGKTTVGRIMGEILRLIGILNPGKLKEIKVSTLNSEGAEGVQKVFDDNIGNVLFIDEAYQASREVMDKLNELMTDKDFQGKIGVILAGYPREMEQLLAMNSGLASRFGDNIIEFPDYDENELWQILLSKMHRQGYSFRDESLCEPLAKSWFSSLPDNPKYANGRKCTLLIERMRRACYCRLDESERDADHLRVFFPEDIVNATVSDSRKAAGSPTRASIVTEHLNVDLSGEDATSRVSGPGDLPFAVGILGTEYERRNASGTFERGRGGGTGFIISKRSRLVMTCSHVVEDGRNLTFRINALGGEESPCRVVWTAPGLDMAVIRVDALPDDARYVELYPEGAPTVAPLTPIIHCGFPLGEQVSRNMMINSGEINNYEKDRKLSGGRRADVYISSIPAAPGCSGGPVLLAESLHVIGLLQGAFEHVGNVGVRIIPDIASVYRDANITITNPNTQ